MENFQTKVDILEDLKEIAKPFNELIEKAPTGLPNFYKVNSFLISRKFLQTSNDRFSRKHFLYYFTNYRQQVSSELLQICKEQKMVKKISITGLQCSGKSYFLADFVLRQRALGKESDFRILYINCSESFIQNTEGLFFELLATVCFDLDLLELSHQKLTLISQLPTKLDSQKEIVECLMFLRHLSFSKLGSKLHSFLELLKEYYQRIGKILMLIWDQINELFRPDHFIKQNIFEEIDRSDCFDIRIVSASNTNENLQKRKTDMENTEIEINPFLSFSNFSEGNERELYELILAEAKQKENRPFDIPDEEPKIVDYAKELVNFVGNSIIEYFYFKRGGVSIFTFEEAKKSYYGNRNDTIRELETEFRKKFVTNYVSLKNYSNCLKKMITFEEYEKLPTEQKVCFSNFNILINLI